MNQFRLLKPEEAAKRATAKVKNWQAEQVRKAAEAKRKPPAAQNPAVEGLALDLSKKTKAELNELLLLMSDLGTTDSVERMLKAGADVNAMLERAGADVNGCEDEWSALMKAARNGRKDNVQLLLGYGADVNAKNSFGKTALMKAAMGGYVEVVQLLIDAKADVNAKDREGATAITWAARFEKTDVVALLKKNGATGETGLP